MIPKTLAALAALVGVLAAAPAHAQTASIRDQVGDAPSRFDLTNVTVSNEADSVTVLAAVKDLEPGGAQIFIADLASQAGGSYYAVTVRRSDGSVATKLARFGEGGFERVKCDVAGRWRMARSDVRLTIPRDCLAEADKVSVDVAIGAGNGSAGDPADWTRTFRIAFS